MYITDYKAVKFPIGSYSRVISLVPSITEILFDIGLGDIVIGVTTFCIYPSYAKKSPRLIIGGTKNPDINLIQSLKPDLIIVNKEENRVKDFHKLNKIASVFVTYPKTIKETIELVVKLAKLFDIYNQASVNNIILNMESTYLEILKQTELMHESTKIRFFCPIWKKPWITLNKDTFAHDMLVTVGGKNIFALKLERYPRIEFFEVLKLKPDLILLPDEPYEFSSDDVLELQSIRALENIPVKIIDGTFHWHSTRIPKQLENLLNVFLKVK